MVVTCLPATRESGATQERMALPSRWTVHAPHRAIPQPNFVPVNPNESRITQSKGVEGSSSTVTEFPFKRKEVTVPSKKLPFHRTRRISRRQGHRPATGSVLFACNYRTSRDIGNGGRAVRHLTMMAAGAGEVRTR